MIKAVIFDCFGVIMTDALKVVRAELLSTRPEAAKELIDTVHATNRGLVSAAVLSRKIASLLHMSPKQCEAFLSQGEVRDQRVLDFVAELRRTYKTALLSNVSRGGLAQRFTAEELDHYFDVVVVSGDVGFAKPEAAVYEMTADRLGVRPNECVMVDDL